MSCHRVLLFCQWSTSCVLWLYYIKANIMLTHEQQNIDLNCWTLTWQSWTQLQSLSAAVCMLAQMSSAVTPFHRVTLQQVCKKMCLKSKTDCNMWTIQISCIAFKMFIMFCLSYLTVLTSMSYLPFNITALKQVLQMFFITVILKYNTANRHDVFIFVTQLINLLFNCC